MTTPFDYAAQAIARLASGFPNEFAWQAWAKRERPTIDKLPLPLRKRVWAAWNNATATEFSRPLRTVGPTPLGTDGAERGEEES